MRPPKYPLDPLARVRARAVDEAARELGESVRAREEAEVARASSERRRDAHDDEARRVRDAEQAALERGALRAGDLMQKDAWEARVAAERAEHDRRVAEAAAREADAHDGERVARGGLAARKADAEVVTKHRDAWDAAATKARVAREEEAATEAWRPKGGKGGR